MKALRWALLATALSMCTPILAADPLKVSLALSASDSVKAKAQGYLRARLGALKDVEIVEPNDADVVVRVTALELKTDVALAMVVLTPFDNRFVTTAAQEKHKDAVGNSTRALFYSPELYLGGGAANELEQVCNEVVAQLDAGLFEDIRKTRRQIEDALRSYKK